MIEDNSLSVFDVVVNGHMVDELLPSDDSLIKDLRSKRRLSDNDSTIAEQRDSVIQQLILRNAKLASFVEAFKKATADDQSDFSGFDLRSRADRERIQDDLEKIENQAKGGEFESEQILRNNFRISRIARGIAGFQTSIFLKSLLFLEDPCVIKGRITRYEFCDESSSDDFCPTNIHGINKHIGAGSGHLAVEMKVETFRGDIAASDIIKTRFTKWEIDIVRDMKNGQEGYRIIERTGDIYNPNKDPFPGTVKFPEANTDINSEHSVWQRGLDHKLYAEGRSICVREIQEEIDGGGLAPVPSNDPRYQTDQDSCIDLMFNGYPTDVLPKKDYCLGRCADPQIVNSDGV